MKSRVLLTRCLAFLALLLSLAWGGVASADVPAWAIDVPRLGPMALYGETPERAVHDYIEGLIRRKAFPGQEKALRAWATRVSANVGTARPLDALSGGRPLSGIQLNSVNDLVGTDAAMERRRAYATGLERAGVASVFFPPADSRTHIDARLASVQHLMLTGGADIHPAVYHADVTHAAKDEINLVRDRYETTLVRRALASKLPIDGTCRGFQMLNVAAGGTLVQDIHADGMTTRAHTAPGFSPIMHPVHVEPGSELERTVGLRIRAAPSIHHEALGTLGKGFKVVGRAPDGVPEAIEGDGGRIRGYQFHAERTLRSAFSKAIFANIASRARDYGAHAPH